MSIYIILPKPINREKSEITKEKDVLRRFLVHYQIKSDLASDETLQKNEFWLLAILVKLKSKERKSTQRFM